MKHREEVENCGNELHSKEKKKDRKGKEEIPWKTTKVREKIRGEKGGKKNGKRRKEKRKKGGR